MPKADCPRVTVFISYSRVDKDFADHLATTLERWEDGNVKVLIDRRDLPFGERWWDMLVDFIHRCDRVIFLVSPDSVKSGWCKKELDQMEAAGRKLVPIIVRETPLSDVPDPIKAVQMLPFMPPAVFETQVAILVTTLYQNVEWSRQRRVIDTLADHWESQHRPRSLLFGAEQVANFQLWALGRPQIEPPLSVISGTYLDVSAFFADKAKHFNELRALRQTVSGYMGKWALLIGGVLSAVVTSGVVFAGHATEHLHQALIWAGSALAGGAVAVPISKKIRAGQDRATAFVIDKENFIKGYGALEEADAFNKSEEAAEAEARKRQEEEDELRRLRQQVSKLDKAQQQPKAASAGEGNSSRPPPMPAGPKPESSPAPPPAAENAPS